MLTRKHFKELVRATCAWGKEEKISDQYYGEFVSDLCDVLSKTNPEFKPVEFVKACFEGRKS